MVTITVYGALFGMLAVYRDSLRPGMIQHAMQDSFSGLAFGLLKRFGKLPAILFWSLRNLSTVWRNGLVDRLRILRRR